jgi:hypothetical protein
MKFFQHVMRFQNETLLSSRDVLIDWNDLDAWCNGNESNK